MENKKTWIGQLLAEIISVFVSKWPSFVKKTYNKIPDELKEKVSIGIKIVEHMKTWMGGDFAKFITHVIPGELDEEIRLKLIDFFDKVLAIDKEVNYLGTFDLKASHAHSIASEINHEITGLPFGQAALTTEIVYQNN